MASSAPLRFGGGGEPGPYPQFPSPPRLGQPAHRPALQKKRACFPRSGGPGVAAPIRPQNIPLPSATAAAPAESIPQKSAEFRFRAIFYSTRNGVRGRTVPCSAQDQPSEHLLLQFRPEPARFAGTLTAGLNSILIPTPCLEDDHSVRTSSPVPLVFVRAA